MPLATAWIQIPGWVVDGIEPTGDLFEGMGWFDTNVDQLKIYYDGSDFVPLAGGLSPDDLHNLALLQGLIDKTADLELRSEREWIAATDAAHCSSPLAGQPVPAFRTKPTLRPSPTPPPTLRNGIWCYGFRTPPISATTGWYSPKPTAPNTHWTATTSRTSTRNRLTSTFGRSYNSNAVGDVLTIEAIELEKETTAYIGNVEGAYPVPGH